MTELRNLLSFRRIGKTPMLLAAGALAVIAAGMLTGGEKARADGPVGPIVEIPAPAMDEPAGSGMETAIFAGGCFWGVQGVFQHITGVESAIAGYAGGHLANPTYQDVTTETTGHAEAVQVTFDPKQVSYGKLLQVFFSVVHNPTELNRQGNDVGTSYRSALFTMNDEQAKVAKAYIAQLDACQDVPGQDRHRGDALHQLLPGRGLPSGRHDHDLDQPRLHHQSRPAEDPGAARGLPGPVASGGGAGLCLERQGLSKPAVN